MVDFSKFPYKTCSGCGFLKNTRCVKYHIDMMEQKFFPQMVNCYTPEKDLESTIKQLFPALWKLKYRRTRV